MAAVWADDTRARRARHRALGSGSRPGGGVGLPPRGPRPRLGPRRRHRAGPPRPTRRPPRRCWRRRSRSCRPSRAAVRSRSPHRSTRGPGPGRPSGWRTGAGTPADQGREAADHGPRALARAPGLPAGGRRQGGTPRRDRRRAPAGRDGGRPARAARRRTPRQPPTLPVRRRSRRSSPTRRYSSVGRLAHDPHIAAQRAHPEYPVMRQLPHIGYGRAQQVVGVLDDVAVALLGEEPLAVRGVFGVQLSRDTTE